MIKISGISQTLNALNKMQPSSSLSKAFKAAGEKILELAEPKVPVQEGILKSSQTVVTDGANVIAGYNSEYASYQHEGRRMDGSHIIRNRPGGGESFFLSSTVTQNRGLILDFIKNQIKKHIV